MNVKTSDIKLDSSRDNLLTPFGAKTMKERYSLPGETPQETYARASAAFGSNQEHAQRLYEYASKHWFGYASPVLANGGTKRGLPISCYLNFVADDSQSIVEHFAEQSALSRNGGAVGAYWGDLRGNKTETSKGSASTGPIPFLKVADSQVLAWAQGKTRRGAYAAYMDISHPQIEEFIGLRKPTGGDENRKCLNSFQAVCIPDAFMDALVADEKWDLVDPHTKIVTKSVKARDLWVQILNLRCGPGRGSPYIFWSDTVDRAFPEALKKQGLKCRHSNLCVAPETRILTDTGHEEIKSLVDEEVRVWNGSEFSSVVVRKTGENQTLITVRFSNGAKLECTPYHKFYVQNTHHSRPREVRAADLMEGDRLIKWEDTPVIDEAGEAFQTNFGYLNGFFSGDGTYAQDKPLIWLYGEKKELEPLFPVPKWRSDQPNQDRVGLYYGNKYNREGAFWPKFTVPYEINLSGRLDWFAGLCDADGTIARNGDNQALQLCSVEKDFLEEVRLMLQTMGVQATVRPAHDEGMRLMPDGKGGSQEYFCRQTYRLLINSNDLQTLLDIGFSPKRLKIEKHKPQRNASRFVTVESVEDEGRVDDTYCFTEPKKGMGVFNGILTGNCSEITLAAREDYTSVCCLSSVNIAKYDEWGDDEQFIPDLIEMLDNVLTVFEREAPEELWRAKRSVQMERSIGLGAMGWHTYLQQNMIPWESEEAVGLIHQVHKEILMEARDTSQRLAKERGEPEGLKGTGWRNAHLIAIAPTAKNSILCGEVSEGIQPLEANAFARDTDMGSSIWKNPSLLKLIPETETETWKSIVQNQGSVQHLDCLTSEQKEVFKTGVELDQMWVIRHAVERQKWVDQAQSVNLFFEEEAPINYVNRVHMAGFKGGLKTLYYVRVKAKARAESTVQEVVREVFPESAQDIACSIDNPESCESCEG